jgi:hypothetical protein
MRILLPYQLRDLAIGVIEITEVARFYRTSFDTPRYFPFIQSFETHSALLHDAFFFTVKPYPVRAGNHTEFTADALFFVNYDNSIFTPETGSRRAAVDARRFFAVHAGHRQKIGR